MKVKLLSAYTQHSMLFVRKFSFRVIGKWFLLLSTLTITSRFRI